MVSIKDKVRVVMALAETEANRIIHYAQMAMEDEEETRICLYLYFNYWGLLTNIISAGAEARWSSKDCQDNIP